MGRPIYNLQVEIVYTKKKLILSKKMDIISIYDNINEINEKDKKVFYGYKGLYELIYKGGAPGQIRIKKIIDKKQIGLTNE
jgi:hypothetical protein